MNNSSFKHRFVVGAGIDAIAAVMNARTEVLD